MKILEIDWRSFLDAVELYQRLPTGARRFFVEKVQPSQGVPNAVMGEWREALLDSRLMVAGVRGKNASVDPRLLGFCRAMRSLNRCRVFDSPSRESFHDFVSEHLSSAEIAAFAGHGSRFYGYHEYEHVDRLFTRVCASAWLKRFLATKDADWEKEYQVKGTLPHFSSLEILKAAQALVQALAKAAAPVPMAQLQGIVELRPDVLAAAIRAGIRYLLFFPALGGAELDPVLGLWPAVARKLSGAASQAPAPVAACGDFHSPFLMEDMTAILSACTVEPLRSRADDYELFEGARQDLGEVLEAAPEWVEREFRFQSPDRVTLAIAFLERFDFLTQKGQRGRDYRMEVTESGSGWFGLRGKDRLKAILDGLRGPLRKNSTLFEDEVVSLVPHPIDTSSKEQSKIPSAMMAPYAGLDADVFVRLREFLAYHRERNNPLLAIRRSDKHAAFWIGGLYVSEPSAEELEEAWEDLLEAFLRQRLLPLGGVKVARDNGGAVCFAMTEAGRYLVGAAADFRLAEEAPGRIVVQPNGDVVFLSPSRKAESEIARFGERKGRKLGTLFKVTKQSILTAAAAGLTRESVLETLREHSSAELPANVEAEISGWFGQYRQIQVRRALLIQCPDEETAVRVIAAAPKKVTPLTATTLELHDAKGEESLLRKLRDVGIFVRTT